MVIINNYRLVVFLATAIGISTMYWITIEHSFTGVEDLFSNQSFTRPQPISTETFLINSPGCKIQSLDPFHPSIKQFIKNSSQDLICSGKNIPSLFIVNGNRIKLRLNVKKSLRFIDKCEFFPVLRKTEDSVRYGKPSQLKLNGETKITDEFIKVQCYRNKKDKVYEDFLPFILRKSKVEKKRQKAVKELKNTNRLSVLILGLDSVPKNQYGRLLRRTDKFIRGKVPFIEFRSYHKVGLNTFPNMLPFNTGKAEKDYDNKNFAKLDMNSLPLVWKNFSKRGYRTLFSEDAPTVAMFNYMKKGFKDPPTDYYLRPFSVAVENSNMFKRSKPAGCFNSRLETSVILKWTEDFFDEFPDEPLFAFTFLSRVSHDDYNGARYQDKPIETMLRSLHKKGHLNRTVVFFISDHGYRYGKLRMTYIGHIEEKLPFNFMILPPWFSSSYPELYANLKTNEKRLVTPFDMHRTLLDIATNFEDLVTYNWNNRSVSLFTPISEMRNCEIAGIESQYCTCIERQQVALHEQVVAKAANVLLSYINSLTKKIRKLCLLFKLVEVVEMTSQKILMNFGQKDEGYAINYQVTLKVSPGEAIFQGIVWYHGKNGSYYVERNVDRISLYGNQSQCVNDFALKSFCYCSNKIN